MPTPDLRSFRRLADRGNLIPIVQRVMGDQLTPVLAYRRLVAPDDRTAPSFLLESVESGTTVGRYSFLGAQPVIEVIARQNEVTVIDHARGASITTREADPLAVPKRLIQAWRPAPETCELRRGLNARFTGGWVGYAGYDTVRYLEPQKLPFDAAPPDDRGLPDMHFGLYRQVAVFDHVDKMVYAINHILRDEHDSVDAAFHAGCEQLGEFVHRLMTHAAPLPAGTVDLDLHDLPAAPMTGNFTRHGFEAAVHQCKEYIAAGDAFQIVLSQRFDRQTRADPFEIYRALRIVNPSPYMVYLQAAGSILVGASPEILCRVEQGVVTNRPLAGTRPRGATIEQDRALEQELLADEKERAEHVMLVDLGRNDLGRVCDAGSIELQRIMEVERYSHVMHLSSTVTGRLRAGLDAWDALRAALPVGTVSGAPKVRAMQIIDELEPTRRGPYAGGIGVVGFNGDMDLALTLRTMVVPTQQPRRHEGTKAGNEWTVHLQAGAGIVADSVPAREYDETVNKAAALGRAIDLAESAFAEPPAAEDAHGVDRTR
ncbi:MAG: anthranilate synthase component I [Planctomycetota bacterium]|nr:anthranilate synthase component I [Planctomycetota bacterium]